MLLIKKLLGVRIFKSYVHLNQQYNYGTAPI